MTSSRHTRSEMSTAASYGSCSLAGSRLTMATFLPAACMNCCMPRQYVVLPLPGGPTTSWPKGMVADA